MSNSGLITFNINVQPRASKTEIVGWQSDGSLKVRLSSAPVDDAANVELVKVLAKALGLTRSDVAITSGAKSRRKRITVDKFTEHELFSRLPRA